LLRGAGDQSNARRRTDRDMGPELDGPVAACVAPRPDWRPIRPREIAGERRSIATPSQAADPAGRALDAGLGIASQVELANAGARLIAAPDWQPIVWTQSKRAKGQAWGLSSVLSSLGDPGRAK